MESEKIFLDKNSFAQIIESKVKNGLTYFEAIVEFCDEADKEPKEVMKFFPEVLLQKVKQSAIEAGLHALK